MADTEMLDSTVDDAKVELDAIEAAFAKKSARNKAVTAIRTGVRAGIPARPDYGVVLGGGGGKKHPPTPRPDYGAVL